MSAEVIKIYPWWMVSFYQQFKAAKGVAFQKIHEYKDAKVRQSIIELVHLGVLEIDKDSRPQAVAQDKLPRDFVCTLVAYQNRHASIAARIVNGAAS